MTISNLLTHSILGTVITHKGVTQTRHLLNMGIKVCPMCERLNPFEMMCCKYCREELIVFVHDLNKPFKENHPTTPIDVLIEMKAKMMQGELFPISYVKKVLMAANERVSMPKHIWLKLRNEHGFCVVERYKGKYFVSKK